MDDLLELGKRIDAANDARNKVALRALIQECREQVGSRYGQASGFPALLRGQCPLRDL